MDNIYNNEEEDVPERNQKQEMQKMTQVAGDIFEPWDQFSPEISTDM